MRPLLVVTRPQPEAAHWVTQLQAQNLQAVALPMLHISACTSPAALHALQQALKKLPQFHAIMFVSVNAVRHFMGRLHAHGHSFPDCVRAWAPGPGTAQALLEHGLSPQQIDQPSAQAAQFDSESLWTHVQAQAMPGHQVLIVRGCDMASAQSGTGKGRHWLTQQLKEAGVQVSFAPVYERRPPAPDHALRQQIESLQTQHAVWLLSSSECARHLVNTAPELAWSQTTALATHPRIAQHAQHLGFGRVIETKPTVRSIAISIESLNDL